MNISKEIVTPDEKGKVFTTDANDAADLESIKSALQTIPEITEVNINREVFPSQIHIVSDEFLMVDGVQECVKKTGFSILPTANSPFEIRN